MALTQAKTWTRFNPGDHAGVIVESTDGDRRVLPASDMPRVSSLYDLFQDLMQQHEALKDKTARWLSSRWDKIDRAYYAVQPDMSHFFLVVRKGVRFDPDLSNELADFDLEVYRDEALGDLNYQSLLLPNCSDDNVNGFIDLSKVLIARQPH